MISFNFLSQQESEIFLAFVFLSFVCSLVLCGLRYIMIRLLAILLFLNLWRHAFCEASQNKTITKYDPNELLLKIFNINESLSRAGPVHLDGENYENDYDSGNYHSPGDEENEYLSKGTLKFSHESNVNTFENDDFVNLQGSPNDSKKKRRRKRKQRQHGPHHPGLAGPGLGFPGIPNPGFGGQHYRPQGPVGLGVPSIASEALSAVTDALTSIALFDDYQCVPRLLCEAAGGGALGGSGILQTVTGLQPLLTLLSAYNGVSTNPLFIFGRAVFLGMSSNGNTGTCRYAYPSCPTDPEQLVYYLNNYNGGFFRFFSAPQKGQQNLEQFYDQLSQNYGQNQQQNFGQNQQQNFGQNQQQNYGQSQQQNYGLYDPQTQDYGSQKPYVYPGHGQQNYGLAFPYSDNSNIRFQKSGKDKIQRRIQNKPISHVNDSDDLYPKWKFPNTIDDNRVNYINSDVYKDNNVDLDNVNSKREVKTVKFPDNNYYKDDVYTNVVYDRKTRGFKFPGSHSNNDYLQSNYESNNNNLFNNKYYVNKNVNVKYINDEDDLKGVRTVYVVRGNGDPNHPEVIKLRPGETIQ